MTLTPRETTPARHAASPAARRLLYVLLATFAVSTLFLILSRWSGSEDLTTAASMTAIPVEAIAAEAVDSISTKRYFTGRVTPRRTSALAFERAGRLEAVLVEEGDRVRRGQALARLDSRDLELRRSELEAQRAQAQARLDELTAGPRQETIAAARAQVREMEQQLELARVQTRRRQELVERQAISREELDRLDFQTRGLEASKEAAEARLEELVTGTRQEQIRAQKGVVAELDSRIASVALDREKSVLQSPFPGRVSLRSADEGAFLSPGQTVLTVVEEGSLEVRIGLPAEAAVGIDIGEPRTIEIGGRELQARATGLLPELEAETRTATMVFALEAPASEGVFPGQIARLALEREEPASGFWAPLEALSRGERGLWACYVAVEMENPPEPGLRRVEQRQVEVLSTADGRALVRGTLSPGDLVVRSGANRITAGQIVRIGG